MQLLRRFMINGLIMSTTSVFLRGLGVVFNAFVSRKLGADGMGLFTLIMSVYGLSVTVAASGVNLAATRMCAEELGKNGGIGVKAAFNRCMLYASVCGIFACTALYLGAPYIADSWLGDIRCTRSLRLLAASLPFIAASNVLHGYFTAIRRVSKSAACQIFEQVFKAVFCTVLLLYFVPDGIEYACMALVGGGALAECLSFLMALALYLSQKNKSSKVISVSHRRALTAELFSITVPVAAAAYVRSGLSTLEHMLIPRGLSKNPLTADTALATYGVLCGMVMPVIMFPTALLYSFTALLIPEFAEAKTTGNVPRLRSMTSRALGLTTAFSVGCAAVMLFFSNEIGMAVYRSREAGAFIGVMAPLIPIMYLDHAVDAILKGLGEQLYCMKVNITDAAMCTLLVYILCPRIGIWGYIVTIYIAEAVNFALSLHRLYGLGGLRLKLGCRFVKPLISAIGALSAVRLLLGLLAPLSLGVIGTLLIGIILSMLFYTVLLLSLGAVSVQDISFIKAARP